MHYLAIIGDIKHSKAIDDRYEAQEQLNKVLRSINKKYSHDIAADFLITLGDEFQGLLNSASSLVDILGYIQREMYPICIRIGIGIGEICTRINRKAAIGADGPAFYAARKAINEVHKKEKKLKKQAPDILIEVDGNSRLDIEQVNTILHLLKIIEDNWSDKQRYTIWDMLLNGGSQEECAKRMKTTQSTIARRLTSGYFAVYEESRHLLREVVRQLNINKS